MARQPVNLGTPPLGQDGDTFRTAAQKWEANFTELYAMAGGAAARILIPADGTLVDKLTPGIYYVLSGAAGAPIAGLGGFLDIANTPDAVGGQVKTEQRFREYDGPRQWRRVYNAGGSSWTAWAKDRDFSLETIGSGVDLNTVLTPGDYFVTPGATNVPAGVTGRARLEVPAILDPGAQEVEQLLYPAATPGILYRRVYTVSSTTWGAWATIGAAPANTDAIPEGSANLYFTQARVRATPLTGIAASTAAITASDTVLTALGKAMGSFANALPRPTNTDAVTLFADTAAVSGWYDKLLGGPYTARQSDHPDGVIPAGTYDEVNYYWVLNITYAGNVFQAAFPYVSAAGNGRERIKFRLKGNGTWTNWQPLTAGNVTRSNIDATAGRLLKAGDGGWMGDIPVVTGATDLDSKTTRGFRFYDTSVPGVAPAGASTGVFNTYGLTGDFVVQDFWERTTSTVLGRKWRRNCYAGGAWTAWKENADSDVIPDIAEASINSPSLGSGRYRVVAGSSGYLPLGSNGYLDHYSMGSGNAKQEYTPFYSARVFVRIYNSGGWSAWAELTTTGYYETTVSWTAGATQTITHNLGVVPRLVEFELIMTAAVNGLAIGDNVNWGGQVYSSNSSWGPEVRKKTTTNFSMIIGSSGFLTWTAAGVANQVTNAQCNLKVKVWA